MKSTSHFVASAFAAVMLLTGAAANAQTAPAPTQASAPTASTGQSGWWIVGGAGFSASRAGCPTCDRDGVYTNGPAFLLDVGLRVTPRLDVGVELAFTNSKFDHDDEDPIRTTFIMGVAQVRPWEERGFFFKAGMGAGFVGNGLYSPIGPPLAPPFTTNTLGLMYGAGWAFQRERRFTAQVYGTHHVAALGELTKVDGSSVKNVLGNYWTIGIAVVFR